MQQNQLVPTGQRVAAPHSGRPDDFLGTADTHFTSPSPSSTQFPVSATKDSRDEKIGQLGLTPPIPTITHVFPDRLPGVNKSSLGHFTYSVRLDL